MHVSKITRTFHSKKKINIYLITMENKSSEAATMLLLFPVCYKHGKKYIHAEKPIPPCKFWTIIAVLTCFFFCASLLSTAEVEASKVFCAAFKAAGLYTVFVRPVDVDNTYQHKFNFVKIKCIRYL